MVQQLHGKSVVVHPPMLILPTQQYDTTTTRTALLAHRFIDVSNIPTDTMTAHSVEVQLQLAIYHVLNNK
jgi:hypothetical protein